MKNKDHLRAASAGIWTGFAIIALVSLVTNALMLTGPLYMLQIYDRVLASRSEQTLLAISILVIGVYILFTVLDGIRNAMLNRVAALFESRLSEAVFRANAVLPLRLKGRDEKIEPIRDLDTCRQVLAGPGPIAIFDLPWMPVYLYIVHLFHPWLGYLAMAGAIVLVALMLLNESLSRGPVRELMGETMSRASFASSARANPGAVVAMGMLGNMTRIWREKTARLLRLNRSAGDRAATFSSTTKGIRLALQSAILGLGAYLAIEGQISPGIMIAASIITARALQPVEMAVANWRNLVAARQARKRLVKVLELTDQAEPTIELPLPKEVLTVEGVASGPYGSPPIIQGFNFGLRAGDGLGVIGPSGSGKTSLARAIIGVWPVIGGAVRMDGSSIDQWSHDRIGKAMGYLPQEVDLFDGTIGQNISRFETDAPAELVVAAARQAGAHEMIARLPEGYDTRLGEIGVSLSAGQRQRVGLARALYGDPFLVVLDEPNANLDLEGDKSLAQAILNVRSRGGIVIVIAHRPSAIASVDKVLFVRNGRQEKFGPKNEVLAAITQNPEVADKAAGSLKVVTDG
ncbi:MAG: type I secretion system permease/ATPase [Rhodobiaceae bacterium]|nr:type I secretion system permease/ATPase [Rhodobiaceae bacterium]